jgi:hypothetical protein
MTKNELKRLQKAVENMHGCLASWIEEVPVRETFKEKPVWKGTVHVFDLTGHSKATRAYAWSSPMPGSSKHGFFAVLKLPPVFSPQDAVRAAIVQEYRQSQPPK